MNTKYKRLIVVRFHSILLKIKIMKVTNKITGENVTKYVIQYLEGKITKDQFEKLTGVTK